jgi:hypothetical protein
MWSTLFTRYKLKSIIIIITLNVNHSRHNIPFQPSFVPQMDSSPPQPLPKEFMTLAPARYNPPQASQYNSQNNHSQNQSPGSSPPTPQPHYQTHTIHLHPPDIQQNS